MTAPVEVGFGTAQLLVDRMPAATARAVLDAALAAGVSRIDTAPLYGHGESEPLVGALLRARAGSRAGSPAGLRVTTKVGLDAAPRPSPARSAVSRVLRSLPWNAAERLRAWRRRGLDGAVDGPTGRFGVAAVKLSIERSLARLGPLDRLLLHEVHAADIGDALLALLAGYQQRGDVRSLGTATGNGLTAACLQRAGGLFTVAHVSVDPLGAPLPDLRSLGLPHVQFVGHGALGPGGRTLVLLRKRLAGDRALRERWLRAVAGSAFEGAGGVAAALLARAAAVAADASGELLVATRRPGAVAQSVRAASGQPPLPAALRSVIETALVLPDRR